MSNETMSSQNRPIKTRAPRFKTFAIILYPDCEMHMRLFRYLHGQSVYRYICMRHNADPLALAPCEGFEVDADESENRGVEKPHIHCMIQMPESVTVSSFLSLWGGVIPHALGIGSPSAYILYMMHATFKSREIDHKPPYPVSDFDSNDLAHFLSLIICTEIDLTGLSALTQMCKDLSLCDMVDNISSADPNTQQLLLRTLKSWQHFIVACNNQARMYDRAERG